MKFISVSPQRSARFLRLIMPLAITVSATSCRHTPEGVLEQEEMAQLMADIHMGEALVDFNYSTYPNDSTRKMLKQSIYAAHKVTAEEVDTSFVWYGNHIEDYITVYDRTIEIIQERQRNLASAGSMQISVAGDSVQVWGGPQRLVVHKHMPSRIIGFSLTPDSTWQKGDIYTLKYKPINSQAKAASRLLIDYSNGTTVYVEDPETRQSTSNVLKIQVDSTLTPLRVYGYISFIPDENVSFEVDSISLTRVRRELMPNIYFHRKTFGYGIDIDKKKAEQDSDSKTSDAPSKANGIQNRHNNGLLQRRVSESEIRTSSDDELPQPSSNTMRPSEHREAASIHKPTPIQRRDAARQRSATTRQKSKVQAPTTTSKAANQAPLTMKKQANPNK